MERPCQSHASLVYSRLKDGIGAEIFGLGPGTEIILTLLKETEIFQAGEIAIHYCVREILRLGIAHKPVAIFTDNPTVVKAGNATRITS